MEALAAVERCFVHIDYQPREDDDHSLTTPIARKVHSSRTLVWGDDRAAEETPLTEDSLTSLLGSSPYPK